VIKFQNTLAGGAIAIIATLVGAFVGAWITIKGQEKIELKKTSLDIFRELLKKIYRPFLTKSSLIIERKKITQRDKNEFIQFLEKEEDLLILCPSDIQKNMGKLRELILNSESEKDKQIIDTLENIKDKVQDVVDKFVLR